MFRLSLFSCNFDDHLNYKLSQVAMYALLYWNKSETSIHVSEIDPSDHAAIANAINNHLASFSQV